MRGEGQLAFTRESPHGLQVPDWVAARATALDRDVVLGQGPTEAEVNPTWWSGENVALRFDESADGKRQIARSLVFHLGEGCVADLSDEDRLLDFVWHALAWGSGSSRRHSRTRITAIRGVSRDQNQRSVDLLRDAIAYARDGAVSEAYGALIRRGGGKIGSLGPAFFTKILYFAAGAEPTSRPRCLILDALVAQRLHAAGWNISPGRGHSWNWYTSTYVSYCELVHRWAAELSTKSTSVHPDTIEYVLFKGPPEEN